MYKQMRYFVAVIETGSFYEAGKACSISQSAVSQQIKALENELQVLLLERHGRRFTVTPAGRYFYDQARLQLQALDSVIGEVRRIGAGETREVRLGVLHGFSDRAVHEALGVFSAIHPQVRLAFTTGTHGELRCGVEAGTLDLALLDRRPGSFEEKNSADIASQPLFALMRRGAALAGAQTLESSMLAGIPCILVAPSGQREEETAYWQKEMGIQSPFLFADNVEEALLNAAGGRGYYLCDGQMPVPSGVVRVPLTAQGKPLARAVGALWSNPGEASLWWELAETVRQSLE